MAYKDNITRNQYRLERPCTICTIIKPKSDFNTYQHRCKTCEDKKLYKCYKCAIIKEEKEFSKDKSRKLGILSICKKCKEKKPRKKTEAYYTRRRRMDINRKNQPIRRLRVFIKGCLKRLNECKSSKAHSILGFTKEEFKVKFPTIPEGYEIDHCIPLSWFKEGTPISISCSLSNLQLLSSLDNAKKKNYFYHQPPDTQYFKDCLKYIDDKYLDLIEIPSSFGGWVGLEK